MRDPTDSKAQPVFVLGADILETYPDIIPADGGKSPNEPSVDLSNAHLIVPIEEIEKLEGASNNREMTALRKLRHLYENARLKTAKVEGDDPALSVLIRGQKVTILPLNGKFETLRSYADSNSWGDRIVLLTNNDALALKARNAGLTTSRYSYQKPAPYTGRRDLTVPNELFQEFWTYGELEPASFEQALPQQPELVANEFIVMQPENVMALDCRKEVLEDTYFRQIGRYDASRDKIVPLKYVSSFPCGVKNPGQAIYAEALMDPQFAAVLCTGPAGSGKTYMATVYGLEACRNGQFISVIVVPCESRSNLGALPGDLDEKMDPSVQPMKNALRNHLLGAGDFKRELENLRKFGATQQQAKMPLRERLDDQSERLWKNWFTSLPIEVARGRDFANMLGFFDEAQDQNSTQMDTLIKRLGADGKIVITGDIEQIHNPRLTRSDNGLVYAKQMLFGNTMVAQVCFTPDEVVRHPLVRAVVHRQAEMR